MKKILTALTLGLMLNTSATTFVEAAPAISQNVAVNVEVNQKIIKTPGIHWGSAAKTCITATGSAALPENMALGRARILARRGAIMDAQRNLLEIVKGLQLDANSSMRDALVDNDEVFTSVSGLVRGAEVIDEFLNDDETYEVVMSMPMYGSKGLSTVAVPLLTNNVQKQSFSQVTTTSIPAAEVATFNQLIYTGVVIDATGLGLEATFSPAIYDTNGRMVYGVNYLDPEMAILNGMVEYADCVQNATVDTRAGENPLVIKAEAVRGGKNSVNNVNVVVSVEDADKILLANQNSGMLGNCAVVFVK